MNYPLFSQNEFDAAFNQAVAILNDNLGLEIRSALKQAASDNGLTTEEQVKGFVILAECRMGLR